jgi:hypothetical protein
MLTVWKRNWHGFLRGIVTIAMLLAIAPAANPDSATAGTQGRLPPLDRLQDRIETQVVVRFKDGVDVPRARSAVSATGGVLKKSSAFNNLRLVEYPTASAAARALGRFKSDRRVLHVFYNQRIELEPPRPPATLSGGRGQPTQAAPGLDPLRTHQYALDRIGEHLAPAPEASAPLVAVLDSGMDYTHPDLADRYQPCPRALSLPCDVVDQDWDPMDTLGHGTHVAGLVAARADASGTRGVSPNSKVLPVRVFGEGGAGDLMTFLLGLEYVTQAKSVLPNLRVANMSWGEVVAAGSAEQREFNVRLAAMRQAGILPIAAAGNDSDQDLQMYPLIRGEELAVMPAMSPYALAVAATDPNDYRANFSNYSTPIKLNRCAKERSDGVCSPDNEYVAKTYRFAPVAAPGWGVLSTLPGGGYGRMWGTSMASPIVAGAAARGMARYPALSPSEVAARLRDTGQPLGIVKGFPITTYRLDMRRALGAGGTGFTGRVVDGLNGRPLAGATVTMRSGSTVVTSALTNGAGFYSLSGAVARQGYTLRATKGSAPAYVANSITATAQGGRFPDPGDISLAPSRADGSYTIMLEWRNTATGQSEYWRELAAREYALEFGTAKAYPIPVRGSSMPFANMHAAFGVPNPEEPSNTTTTRADSVEFSRSSPGSLATFPYGRIMHDSESDSSPHEGTVIRRLPATGSVRYGVYWLSPGGFARPAATVSLYRNSVLLKRSCLSGSIKDSSSGQGVWALYDITSRGFVTVAGGDSDGRRSAYRTWIERNNNIQGTPGPSQGGAVTARLNGENYPVSSIYDIADIYRVQLTGGLTYTFNLNGAAGTDFGLALYAPDATNIYAGSIPVEQVFPNGSSDKSLTYRVPANKGGAYYVAATAEGAAGTLSGQYTLSRP